MVWGGSAVSEYCVICGYVNFWKHLFFSHAKICSKCLKGIVTEGWFEKDEK
jgi:hypothetical protein